MDGFGREILVLEKDLSNTSVGNSRLSRYDELGRLVFKSYPDVIGATLIDGVNYAYDALDRKILAHYNVNNSTESYSHVMDNRVVYKNTKNISTQFQYESFGNPEKKNLIGILTPPGNSELSSS